MAISAEGWQRYGMRVDVPLTLTLAEVSLTFAAWKKVFNEEAVKQDLEVEPKSWSVTVREVDTFTQNKPDEGFVALLFSVSARKKPSLIVKP